MLGGGGGGDCNVVLSVLFSFAVILLVKRTLLASMFAIGVVCLYLAASAVVGLWSVVVVFPDHTLSFFLSVLSFYAALHPIALRPISPVRYAFAGTW